MRCPSKTANIVTYFAVLTSRNSFSVHILQSTLIAVFHTDLIQSSTTIWYQCYIKSSKVDNSQSPSYLGLHTWPHETKWYYSQTYPLLSTEMCHILSIFSLTQQDIKNIDMKYVGKAEKTALSSTGFLLMRDIWASFRPTLYPLYPIPHSNPFSSIFYDRSDAQICNR